VFGVNLGRRASKDGGARDSRGKKGMETSEGITLDVGCTELHGESSRRRIIKRPLTVCMHARDLRSALKTKSKEAGGW
jgi:hypothetical protein